jgi:hypothetical protein
VKRLLLLSAVTAATVFAAACSDSDNSTAPDLGRARSDELAPGTGPGSAATPHLFAARGYVKNQARPGGGSPNLTWHGGPVMHGATIKPIYWGSGWNNTSFKADKVSGLKTFYSGFGASAYAQTNTEYTDGSGNVGVSSTYQTEVFDAASEPPTRNIQTSAIFAEVCKMIPESQRVTNGYYPVYTTTPRGHAGYCAWHSAGTCAGSSKTIQFAFFFNLDGDAGCDPADPGTTHSQGLEALANVTGHELSEAVTDPHLDAWYDAQGAENSDKCAWTFAGNVTVGGSSWKIQGNWSNAAYNTKSGYDGAGCIQTR